MGSDIHKYSVLTSGAVIFKGFRYLGEAASRSGAIFEILVISFSHFFESCVLLQSVPTTGTMSGNPATKLVYSMSAICVEEWFFHLTTLKNLSCNLICAQHGLISTTHPALSYVQV